MIPTPAADVPPPHGPIDRESKRIVAFGILGFSAVLVALIVCPNPAARQPGPPPVPASPSAPVPCRCKGGNCRCDGTGLSLPSPRTGAVAR